MTRKLGIELQQTTAYHPQANGQIECFHRTLKASLMARLSTSSWIDKFPWVLLGFCMLPREDLQTSTAELVYSAPLLLPGKFVALSTVDTRLTAETLYYLCTVTSKLQYTWAL